MRPNLGTRVLIQMAYPSGPVEFVVTPRMMGGTALKMGLACVVLESLDVAVREWNKPK